MRILKKEAQTSVMLIKIKKSYNKLRIDSDTKWAIILFNITASGFNHIIAVCRTDYVKIYVTRISFEFHN